MDSEQLKQAYEYGCQLALDDFNKFAAEFDAEADPIKPETMGILWPLIGPIGSGIAGYHSPRNMDTSPGWRSLGGGLVGGIGGALAGGALGSLGGPGLKKALSRIGGLAAGGYGAARGYTSAFSPEEQQHYFGKEYNFPL